MQMPSYALSFAMALALSLAFTPVVRAIARKVGMVAKPRADRWHTKPTALMGGVGIFAAFLPTYLAFRSPGVNGDGLVVLCASSMFVLGFVDDVKALGPKPKLTAQIAAALGVTAFGLTLSWTPWPAVNTAITVFWLVGVTNALNLLDNMDGLSSGVAAIAAMFMAWFFIQQGKVDQAAMATALGGACIGFLVFNWNPASVFMGDSGSLFLGFLLSGLGLLQQSHRSRGLFSVLAPPVLVLAIPIIDTTLVTVLRKLNGRPVSQGGRDHASHRLVALGLTERRAVMVLHAIAVVSGLLGVCAYQYSDMVALLLVIPFALAVLGFGAYLGRVPVYGPKPSPPPAPIEADQGSLGLRSSGSTRRSVPRPARSCSTASATTGP